MDVAVSTLRRLIRYEPDTGALYWLPRDVSDCGSARARNRFNTIYAGHEALTADNGTGYRAGTLMGHSAKAHRVAWALFYGE